MAHYWKATVSMSSLSGSVSGSKLVPITITAVPSRNHLAKSHSVKIRQEEILPPTNETEKSFDAHSDPG